MSNELADRVVERVRPFTELSDRFPERDLRQLMQEAYARFCTRFVLPTVLDPVGFFGASRIVLRISGLKN